MKKLILLILSCIALSGFAQRATNYWDGSFNSYWHNNANWSLGHIPTATEDVVIPNGMPRYPSVDFYDEVINSLTIQSNAEVRIYDQILNVAGDVNVYGELGLLDNAAVITCDDITWQSGSTVQTTGDCDIYCFGTWEFAAGANVQLDHGYVAFYGTGTQYIRSKDADCYFNNIWVSKSGGLLGLSGQSSATCKIKGDISLTGSNFDFVSYSSQTIQIAGYFTNIDPSINIAVENGSLEFTGSSACYYRPQTGDYINNLIVNSGSYDFDLNTLFTTITEIKGDVTINSGRLDVNGMDLIVGGDWDNNVGLVGFWERDRKVTFNGSGHQYCSDEYFYSLEINKSSGALRMNGTDVECALYDWTAGAVDVLSGSFTANDLVDNAIQGIFYLNPGGIINLHNDGGYIDLKGDLFIYGGEFNVYGGSVASYWPYLEDASITMSDGVLDIKEQGILINNNAYALNDNITGGRIKCAGNLYIDRADFTPNAGGFEMYGPTNANVRCINGGRFWDLVIDKVDGGKDAVVKPYTDRDGTYYDGSRGNTATATSNILCYAHLYIDNGTFNMSTYDFTANGSAVVYGSIVMNSAANDFTVNMDMQWRPGATADITQGNFWVKGNWDFPPDISVHLGTGNAVHLNGTNTQFLYSNDDDSHIGNLLIENTSNMLWMHSTSTQPLHVAGSMHMPSGSAFQIQGKSLVVDGELDIEDGATMYLSSSGGGQLTNNSDMELEGNLYVGSGNALINGMFDLMATGTLSINGGSFVNNGSDITRANFIYGELNMTGGLYQAEERVYIASTATTNISGGTIKCRGFEATMAPNFQPTGGTVELRGFTDYAVNVIECTAGNYFHNLEINAASYSGAQPVSDISVQNNLTITSGSLYAGTYEVTVQNNVDIYGMLNMTLSGPILSCYEITWHPGSGGLVNSGDIYCLYWNFMDGTDIMLSPGNTVHIIHGIDNEDPDAEFGNIIIGDWSKSSSKNTRSAGKPDQAKYVADGTITNNQRGIPEKENPPDNSRAYSRKVTGNCTYLPGTYWGSTVDIIVQGTLDIQNGASQALGSSNTIYTYSHFTLHGKLDLGSQGNGYVDGEFNVASTGELVIKGGEFIVENSSTSYNRVYGIMTMTDGLFWIDHNIKFESTATANISGGMIRSGGFFAQQTGAFEPTGGTVEILSASGGQGAVDCSDGNFLYNFSVDAMSASGGAHLNNDLLVTNNFEVLKGIFNLDGFTASVQGNTTFYDGGLWMKESTDVLNAGDDPADEILWTSEATFEWNDLGIINIFGDCTIENGVSFDIEPGQTFTFLGTGDQEFNNMDDATFGTVELDKPSGALIIPSGSSVVCQRYDWTEGALTVQGGSFTAADLADYILEGNISLHGGLIDFTQDLAQNLAVEGNLTISDGTFNLRGGAWDCKLALTGALFLTMSGGTLDFIDNGVDISSTLLIMNMTGGTIRTNENFKNINPGFMCNGGSIELYGFDNTLHNTAGYFNDLLVEGIYSCPTDLLINGNFYPNNIFIFEGNELTCMGDVELYYGELMLTEGSTLRLNNNSTISVGFFSFFTSLGTESEMNIVTGVNPGDRYNFTVESNASLEATHTIFENMSANGIYMSEGSWFLNQGFYGCTFRNGAEGGTLLTLNNTYSAEIIGAVFENTADGAAYNVTKTNDQGEFTFIDYSGNFAGSAHENDPNGRIHWFEPELTVLPWNRNVGASAGSTTFEVQSNIDWTVSESFDWIEVSPSSGSGNATLTVDYYENISVFPRIASFTVSGEDVPNRVLTVTQAGANPVLSVTPANQNVGAAAGTVNFSLTSNTSWSVSESVDWLSVSPMNGNNNKTLVVTYDENTSVAGRIGDITVSASGVPDVVVTVTQSGADPVLSVTPANQNVGSAAGTVNFSLTSNTSWSVSESVSWLSVSPMSGNNSKTLVVTYDENTSIDGRVGEITVSASGVPDVVVTVTQSGAGPVLSVTPANQNVGAAAGTVNFSLTSNTSWSMSESVSWLSVSPMSGNNSKTLVVTYDENTSIDGRVGEITVSASGVPDVVVTVTQAGADPILAVTPPNQNVGATAGTVNFSLTSNTSWSVSESVSWLSVSPMSGNNNNTLVVTFDENTSIDGRVGEITVSASGVPDVVVTVTQSGADQVLSVTPANQNVGAAAGTVNFSLTSNTSWSVSESVSWLSVSPMNGNNNNTLVVTFDENTSIDGRVGEITVSASGVPDVVVTVTQSGAGPVLSVTPANQNVGAAAGTVNFSLTSNTSWSVSESVSWLSVSPMNGNNNNTLVVTFDENISIDGRVGEITVSASGVPDVVVTVTQAGADPILAVTPPNQNVGATAGNTTFNIESNTSWTVSEIVSWLSVNPAGGSGNAALDVSYDVNNTGAPRVGEITVSTDGKLAVVVTVTQNGNLPELSVDPGFFDFLAPNGIDILNVYSNTTWLITDDMDWLGLNLDTPSGNQVVQVSVQMNNSGVVRSGEITVETEDGSILIIIPVTQQPFVEHIISLPAGWSGLSSYALPLPPFIDNVFAPIMDELVIAVTNENVFYPAYNINTIGFWQEFSAYKIKTTEAVDLNIYGSAYPSKTMTLDAGWNLLPVISDCPVDVEALFAPTAGSLQIVKDIAGWGVYWPAMGINTIGTLQPGRAYYVLTDEEVSITFEDCGKGAGNEDALPIDENHKALAVLAGWNAPALTPVTHSIGINREAAGELASGSIIGVFDDTGHCFGLAEVNNHALCVTAFGNDPYSPEKDGFEEGEELSFRAFNPVTGVTTVLSPVFAPGQPDATGLFTENGLSLITGFMYGSTGIQQVNQVAEQIYPNPSAGAFTVEGFTPGATISIADMNGQEVYHETHETTTAGIDLGHCRPGVYLVRIAYRSAVSYHKLVLK